MAEPAVIALTVTVSIVFIVMLAIAIRHIMNTDISGTYHKLSYENHEIKEGIRY